MSYYYDILTAAKAKVAAIPSFSATPVVVRKRPFFSASHGDTLPTVILSPDKERIVKLYMPDGVWVDYPVYVTVVGREGSKLQSAADVLWILQSRESIRGALWKPVLAGASSVFDCDHDPNPPYDFGGLDQLYDVSVQLFTFRSNEPR